MKKVFIITIFLIFSLNYCSCSSLQSGMAEVIASMYGVDDAIKEEYEEYYQAEWDAFFDSAKELKDLLQDEIENNINKEETVSNINWDSITEEDKFTPGNILGESGYTDYYNNKFSKGQCTWYAYSRFYETTNIDINLSGDAKTWLDTCNDDRVSIICDPTEIVSNSIAVDYKTNDPSHPGHVTFIEHVTYDENGNPVDVYFTESNWDSNGKYDVGIDGIVKKLSYEDFINRGSHKVKGYIVPN